ncbi:MAG: electron transfer flavoprotein subunit alpha/FixB family protein [Bacillota bacterium]|nr:electron transfer flavoprotein subunit alpha/FixB family protein [Bacillota bacterium]
MTPKKFWVISEQQKLLAELVNGVKALVQGEVLINAVAVGNLQAAEAALAAGAHHVFMYRLDGRVQVEGCYRRLAQLIKETGGDLVLVGATKRGKTLAALLAAELESGLATEVTVLDWSGDLITTQRFVFGGLAVSTDTFVSGIPIVTIPPRMWESPAIPATAGPGDSRTPLNGELVEISGEEGPVRVLEQRPRQSGAVNLDDAQVVICIGRGVKKREDLVMFEELAGLLEGVLACTRPVAEEEGYRWFSEDSYIGISGRKVKPRLYLSIGSSGQIQHVVGCRDAGIILGIDKNEDAPIFEASDYGIVGDLYQVVPELIKRIREIKSR